MLYHKVSIIKGNMQKIKVSFSYDIVCLISKALVWLIVLVLTQEPYNMLVISKVEEGKNSHSA